MKSLQFDILKQIQYLQFSIFPGSGFTCMQHKKRFRVSKIGIKSQSHKIVGVCGRKSEREGELMKATQIVLFRFFLNLSSCNISSTVLTSCQGLCLLYNCVHFSHRDNSKGLLFSNNTIFLSREYRHSHARLTRKYTNVLVIH